MCWRYPNLNDPKRQPWRHREQNATLCQDLHKYSIRKLLEDDVPVCERILFDLSVKGYVRIPADRKIVDLNLVRRGDDDLFLHVMLNPIDLRDRVRRIIAESTKSTQFLLCRGCICPYCVEP